MFKPAAQQEGLAWAYGDSPVGTDSGIVMISPALAPLQLLSERTFDELGDQHLDDLRRPRGG